MASFAAPELPGSEFTVHADHRLTVPLSNDQHPVDAYVGHEHLGDLGTDESGTPYEDHLIGTITNGANELYIEGLARDGCYEIRVTAQNDATTVSVPVVAYRQYRSPGSGGPTRPAAADIQAGWPIVPFDTGVERVHLKASNDGIAISVRQGTGTADIYLRRLV